MPHRTFRVPAGHMLTLAMGLPSQTYAPTHVRWGVPASRSELNPTEPHEIAGRRSLPADDAPYMSAEGHTRVPPPVGESIEQAMARLRAAQEAQAEGRAPRASECQVLEDGSTWLTEPYFERQRALANAVWRARNALVRARARRHATTSWR